MDENSDYFSQSGRFDTTEHAAARIKSLSQDYLEKLNGQIVKEHGHEYQNHLACDLLYQDFNESMYNDYQYLKTQDALHGDVADFLVVTLWNIAIGYTWSNDYPAAKRVMDFAASIIEPDSKLYKKFNEDRNNMFPEPPKPKHSWAKIAGIAALAVLGLFFFLSAPKEEAEEAVPEKSVSETTTTAGNKKDYSNEISLYSKGANDFYNNCVREIASNFNYKIGSLRQVRKDGYIFNFGEDNFGKFGILTDENGGIKSVAISILFPQRNEFETKIEERFKQEKMFVLGTLIMCGVDENAIRGFDQTFTTDLKVMIQEKLQSKSDNINLEMKKNYRIWSRKLQNFIEVKAEITNKDLSFMMKASQK